jgi:hypothetical protein
VNMNISGRFCAGLTVQPPGERLAVAEEARARARRSVEVKPCMTIQLWSSRAQNDETPLGRVFPVEEDHQAQATLKCFVPHHGSIQMPMWFFCPGSEVLERAQGLDVNRSIICAPGPTALRVWTGGETPAVGLVPACSDGVPIEADHFIQVLLLRLPAIHAMRGDARRQALPMRTPWLRGEVAPGVFRLGLRGLLSRRRLRDGERESAPACDLYHGERGHLQPAFGTTRTAVEEGPTTARLLATLRDEGRVMRRDHCRAWVEHRHQHALMKGWPVKRLPKLSCNGAFSVGAVATQVAEVDATTPHKNRDNPRGQELPLW